MGARRRGVDDGAQRRQIVPPSHILGQLQQPDEHGRHHEHGVEALALDQLQQRNGIEARHQYHHFAHAAGAHGKRVRRGMIERPRHDRADSGHDAEDVAAHALDRHHLLRRRRRPAHALGMACRAGGVEHGQRGHQHLAGVGWLPPQPRLVIDGAGHGAGGHGCEAVGRSHLRWGRHGNERDVRRDIGRDGAEQVGMADQHAGAAVGEDVGDLLGLEVPVDRHGVGAERLRRVGRLHEGDVVAHQDGDALARRHAQHGQPRRDAAHSRVQRVGAQAPRAADEPGRYVRHDRLVVVSIPGRA